MVENNLNAIIKMKSALYSGGSKGTFLEKAVLAYNEPSVLSTRSNVEIFNKNNKKIVIKNTPIVNRAEAIFENLHLTAALEEILSDCEKDEVDFNQLIEVGEVQ